MAPLSKSNIRDTFSPMLFAQSIHIRSTTGTGKQFMSYALWFVIFKWMASFWYSIAYECLITKMRIGARCSVPILILNLAHKINSTCTKYDTFWTCVSCVSKWVSDWVCAHSKRLHCPFSLLFRASKFREFGLVVEQSVPLSLHHESTEATSSATTTKNQLASANNWQRTKCEIETEWANRAYTHLSSSIIVFFPLHTYNLFDSTRHWCEMYTEFFVNESILSMRIHAYSTTHTHANNYNVTSINVFICRYVEKTGACDKRQRASAREKMV